MDVSCVAKSLAILCVTCLVSEAARAEADNSAFGTYPIAFQSVQAGGTLKGCSLVYTALVADFAYLRGQPVMVNGNISTFHESGSVVLGFKVGVKEIGEGKQWTRPHFAYLQTASRSSAKERGVQKDADEGYRLFVYSLYEPKILELLGELVESRRVTLAFNRKEGGLDVLVPLELDVIEANSVGTKVTRKRSGERVSEFLACFQKLLSEAEASLKNAK